MVDVSSLLTRQENNTFDRKATNFELDKLANLLIAFANSDGGTVAVGIKEQQFEGILKLNSSKQNDFSQIGIDRVSPTLLVEREDIPVILPNGKADIVITLTVQPSAGVLYANNKDEVYLRVGDETKKQTYEQRRNLEYDKNIRTYETMPMSSALLTDLDEKSLQKFVDLNDYKEEDIWNLLYSRGLANREVINDKLKYTLNVAGWLMFARTPTTLMTGARIRFIRYDGNEAKTGTQMNVIKNEWVEGPLDNMLNKISDILESQLRTFARLDEKTGKFEELPEYPRSVWQEAIVNAVTHRAYNLAGDDIRVIMYDDRLQIHSPGGLPSTVTTENIRTTHYSRNPVIARTLAIFGWVREFGEGVDRMFNDMEQYFLEDPEYLATANTTDLILKNNIIARASRRNDNLEDRFSKEWSTFNYLEKHAITLAYENGIVRRRDLVNDNVSSAKARRLLVKLAERKILEKKSTSLTDPQQYYVLTK